MNYLCHARDCLDRPYELVGAVLPDWLRTLDRGARIRPWMVDGITAARGSPRAQIVAGLRRHFADDAWFHSSPVFQQVCEGIAGQIRAVYPDRPGRRMRASFYAHLLLEMLLDAWLMECRPDSARAFCRAMQSLDREAVVREAGRIAPVPVPGLEKMVERFCDPGVLRAYADDTVVAERLNRMGKFVHQPDLPPEFLKLVGPARSLVRQNGEALLTRPGRDESGEGER